MTVPVLHARGRNGGSLRFAHTNSFLQSRIIVRARRSIDMRARWKNLSTDRVGGKNCVPSFSRLPMPVNLAQCSYVALQRINNLLIVGYNIV